MATTTEPPSGGTDSLPDDRHSARRRVAAAALLMMGGILLSRVLGLVRDRVIAHQYGQTFESDAYNAAFTIPDLIFFLIAGGAFSSAFTPVFTEYLTLGKKKEAWRIFSAVVSMMALVVSALIILAEIFATPLVTWTNPGYTPEKIALTTFLTRILLPAQLCFFLGGLMMSALNAMNRFSGQAMGPVIYNLGIILGGLLLTRWFGVAGLCWGAVGGAVVGNLVVQWALVRRNQGYFVPSALRENWNHPGVREVWRLMLPVILGLALPQVSTIIGRIFAAGLGDGPQTALMNANRLMQVPLGVFAQAIAIASLPTMAAQAARQEFDALRDSLSYSLRSILFLTVPSSLLMVVLALPIIQLLLQSGKFGDADARMTADVLKWFSVGIFAWSGHSIVTRGFYALKESRVPVLVGTLVTFLFIPLNWPFRARMGVGGLALATSIAATLHLILLLILLRKRLNGLDGARLLRSTLRITLASLITAGVCLLTRNFLQQQTAHLHVTTQSALVLTGSLAVSFVIYVGLALALRMEEVSLLRRLLNRFTRKRAAS
jgi:putative peptidoglycan lipid II flippase